MIPKCRWISLLFLEKGVWDMKIIQKMDFVAIYREGCLGVRSGIKLARHGQLPLLSQK